jgi:LysR family hydrogen peroxide-inducible transcriptional activator
MAAQLPEPVDISHLPKKSIFLLQQEHCMTGHAVSACNLQHSDQISSVAASSLYTLVQLAKSKMGYTFLPELALNQSIIRHTNLKSFAAEEQAYREIGLVWRSGTTRMQLFRRVGEIIAPLLPIPKLT